MGQTQSAFQSMLLLAKENKVATIVVISLLLLSVTLEAFAISVVFPLIAIMLDMDQPSVLNETLQTLNEIVKQFSPISVAIFVVSCFVLKSIILQLSFRIIAVHVSSFAHDLRRSFIDAILSAKMSYLNSKSLGQNLSVLTNDSMRSAQAFVSFTRALSGLLQVLLYASYALWLSVYATLVSSITVIMLIVLIRRTLQHTRAIGTRVTAHTHELSNAMGEAIRGIKASKAMANEKFLSDQIQAESDSLRNAHRKSITVAQLLRNIQEPVLVGSALLCMIVYKDYFLLEPTQILFTLAIYYRLMTSVNTLQSDFLKFLSQEPALASMRRTISESRRAQEIVTQGGESPPKNCEDILLSEISVRYDDKILFNASSYIFPKNKLCLLKGESGLGKTTMIDLICAMVQPSTGNVYIGKQELKKIDTRKWRQQLGYVDQFPFLFKGTIRENIVLANEATSDDALHACIEKCQLSDLIETLERGANHLLDEGGTNLSGGQRQRIAIARAIFRQPNYLILDEPTSALDPSSTEKIFQTLKQLTPQMSVIVVTHNSDVDHYADHIIDLNQG